MTTQIKENLNPGLVIGDVNSGADWAGITGYTSLLLGTLVSQFAPGPTVSPLEIHSIANGSVMAWCHNDNPWVTGEYALMKSKGTQAAPATLNGDELGGIGWNGYDGAHYQLSAYIIAQANGNFGPWSPTQRISVLEFQTTPSGVANIEVFRMGDVNPGVLPQNTSEINLSITGGHVLGFLPGSLGNKPDASLSRLAPASFAMGNGLQGDFSATLKLGTEILTAPAPNVAANQVGFGATTDISATAGTNGAVPAQVLGYLIVNIGGTTAKIPYYSA